MLFMPEKVSAICHPLIASLYIKHASDGDVLVIETNFSQDKNDYELYDAYLTELLFDLDNIRMLAEEKVGHIDRVDIRAGTLH